MGGGHTRAPGKTTHSLSPLLRRLCSTSFHSSVLHGPCSTPCFYCICFCLTVVSCTSWAHASLAISRPDPHALAFSPGTAFSLQYPHPAPFLGSAVSLGVCQGKEVPSGVVLGVCAETVLPNERGRLCSPPSSQAPGRVHLMSQSLCGMHLPNSRVWGITQVAMFLCLFFPFGCKWDFFLKHRRSGVAPSKQTQHSPQDSSDCLALGL